MKAWSGPYPFKRDEGALGNFPHQRLCRNLLFVESTQGNRLGALTVPWYKFLLATANAQNDYIKGMRAGSFPRLLSPLFSFLSPRQLIQWRRRKSRPASLPFPLHTWSGGAGAAGPGCAGPGRAVRPVATGGHDSPPAPLLLPAEPLPPVPEPRQAGSPQFRGREVLPARCRCFSEPRGFFLAGVAGSWAEMRHTVPPDIRTLPTGGLLAAGTVTLASFRTS